MNIINKSYLKKKILNKSFENVTLKNCNFWESNLKNVTFKNVKIIDCVFCDAMFKDVTFIDCIITGSNFSHSIFYNTKILRSRLVNLNFRDSLRDQISKIPKYISVIPPKKNKKTKTKFNKLEKKILYALTKGKGFYILNNYFEKKKIKKAFDIVDKVITAENKYRKFSKHFARDKKLNQKYVYNILNKDKVFSELIQPKIAMKIFKKLLGDNFICGFFWCKLSATWCKRSKSTSRLSIFEFFKTRRENSIYQHKL